MTNIEFDGDEESEAGETYRDMIAGIMELEDYMAAHGLHAPPQSD